MSILVDRISKRYGEQTVVDQVTLNVADGELVVLLGSSGSGKSTILRMVAGLISPDEGRILLDDSDITNLPPQQRGFGLLFQNYSIFPHMTVAENIEFGLMIRNVPLKERQARSKFLLDLVGLPGLGTRSSGELSGGQLQRVALARALAYKPRVLLLDEPFGALDVRTRVQLRQAVKDVIRKVGVTTIMVTHDQEEAFELADRVAVVSEGRIEQYGQSFDIYYKPATRFSAGFVGDINFFDGVLVSCTNDLCEIRLFDSVTVFRRGRVDFPQGQKVLYGVRPEQMRVSLLEPKDYENGVMGVIEKSVFLGDVTRYSIRLANSRLLEVQILNYLFVDGLVVPYELNEAIWLIWSHGSGIIMVTE